MGNNPMQMYRDEHTVTKEQYDRDSVPEKEMVSHRSFPETFEWDVTKKDWVRGRPAVRLTEREEEYG